MPIYDYDVKITPEKLLSGPRKARIFDLLEGSPECAPHKDYLAHDRSARLVSTRQLPQPLKVKLTYSEEGDTRRDNALVYTVEIKFVRILQMQDMTPYLEGRDRHYDPAPLVSAANLILQKHVFRSGGIRVGQNRFFFPSMQPLPLTLGLEARRGYFMSVRPIYKQLAVNVNVCMTTFYVPGNLAEAMFAFQNSSAGGMPEEFSEKLKVVTRYRGYRKTHTISKVMSTTPRRTRFQDDKGRSITVEQYFKDKYNITLKYADQLPLINVGTFRKANFIPPELCEIPPGQAYRGILDANTTRQMIGVACNPPAQNAAWIVDEGLSLLGLRGNTTLGNFKVEVNPEMTVIPARILAPPRIQYKLGSRQANVQLGSWNIVDVKFHLGGTMKDWAVLLVQDGRQGEFAGPDDPQLIAFIQTLVRKCLSSGMQVGDSPAVLATPLLPRSGNNDPSRKLALQRIYETIRRIPRRPQFILFLLSGVDKYIRPGIKRHCDMEIGVHSGCMLLDKARARGDANKQDQYFSNVALKVNAKLGGVNHLLAPDATMNWLSAKKTMLVGIDVTHPSPLSLKGTPSIAALVASNDDKFVQFPCALRLQKNRNVSKDAEEMVADLTEMMIERLSAFEKKTKTLPD